MKVALFDWTVGGHHPRYVRKFAEALGSIANVILAIPDEMVETIKDLPVEVFALGKARPNVDMTRPLPPQNRELAYAELDLFEKVAKQIQPDHLIHLYADPVIRRLVKRPSLNVPTTLCIFFPRAHYPSLYNSPLSPKERLRAWFLEYLVARWRRRSDAHALFALDEEAVRRWSGMDGARAFWLPEPAVPSLQNLRSTDERSGCIIYGALDTRKGIHLLVRAVTLAPNFVKVVLAGLVEPTFEGELARFALEMRKTGAVIEVHVNSHSEMEGLNMLAKARCAVLPYPRHYGMSRVLLEACSVGTPVIVHRSGLLGHLVEKYELGKAVDCKDPRALRQALIHLCETDRREDYTEALKSFAARFSKEVFEVAVTSPFMD